MKTIRYTNPSHMEGRRVRLNDDIADSYVAAGVAKYDEDETTSTETTGGEKPSESAPARRGAKGG